MPQRLDCMLALHAGTACLMGVHCETMVSARSLAFTKSYPRLIIWSCDCVVVVHLEFAFAVNVLGPQLGL